MGKGKCNNHLYDIISRSNIFKYVNIQSTDTPLYVQVAWSILVRLYDCYIADMELSMRLWRDLYEHDTTGHTNTHQIAVIAIRLQ